MVKIWAVNISQDFQISWWYPAFLILTYCVWNPMLSLIVVNEKYLPHQFFLTSLAPTHFLSTLAQFSVLKPGCMPSSLKYQASVATSGDGTKGGSLIFPIPPPQCSQLRQNITIFCLVIVWIRPLMHEKEHCFLELWVFLASWQP